MKEECIGIAKKHIATGDNVYISDIDGLKELIEELKERAEHFESEMWDAKEQLDM